MQAAPCLPPKFSYHRDKGYQIIGNVASALLTLLPRRICIWATLPRLHSPASTEDWHMIYNLSWVGLELVDALPVGNTNLNFPPLVCHNQKKKNLSAHLYTWPVIITSNPAPAPRLILPNLNPCGELTKFPKLDIFRVKWPRGKYVVFRPSGVHERGIGLGFSSQAGDTDLYSNYEFY